MPHVLVTGANGFIGRSLCARLVAEGWRVRATVRRTGAEVVPGAVAKTVVVSGSTDWVEVLRGIDVVIHLAARVHVMKEQEADPRAAFHQTNVAGTERLVRAAATARVRRLIFLSTIGVHGNIQAGGSITEQAPVRPHNLYSRSKLEAEQSMRRVSESSGLETVVVRAPLVYGPGNPGNFLRLLRLVRAGWPLPLASVRNRRSFVYVDNLVDAILLCASHPKASGRTFAISDGQDSSTPELVRELAELLGRPARLLPFPPALLRAIARLTGLSGVADSLTASLVVDTRLIRSELGWTPPRTLKEGLKATAEWYLKSHEK